MSDVQPKEPAVFRSRVDPWLAAVIVGAAVVSAGAVVAVVLDESAERSPSLFASLAVLVLIGVILPVWVLQSTRYALDGRYLHVRSGPFRWRVPLDEIRAVTPTRNPLASPALSLDRLRIDRGRNGSIMISPADKDGFLAELERRRNRGWR